MWIKCRPNSGLPIQSNYSFYTCFANTPYNPRFIHRNETTCENIASKARCECKTILLMWISGIGKMVQMEFAYSVVTLSCTNSDEVPLNIHGFTIMLIHGASVFVGAVSFSIS
ncbi:MAG: hypothetical protein EAX95_03620 [Candidatus Thorarchaeota archaeon]|nr:hypothetical protein [Candidatus Thorarchaeota archaeon]